MTLPEAKPVAILMVEDSPTDAKLIVAELRLAGLSFELERVEDEDGLRAALERREWDLVLCDWFLPKLTAPEVLPILRTLRPDLPFIILSGSVGEQHAVDAMRAGASDYVLKDRLARLAPSIERELRESEARRRQRKLEARFQAVVERSSNAVALTTADGTIAYASPAAGAILGMSPESLLGTRFTDHLSPHDRKLAETPWSGEDASLDRAVTAELRVEARTGPCRWIEATWINKLRDPDIAAIVCNFRDISERRRASEAEAALRQTETQLRHAQKMEAIGRLAGGVAHDFNNILAVILSYTELCLSDLGPSNPSHADMDEVRRAAERGAALTQQLLLFSRQRAVEPVLTDVNEVIGVTEKMLMRILGEDVKTVVVRSHEKAFVRIAPGQLEQILMNLVVNARDAMPTGGMVTIEATTLVLPEEHGLANGVRAGRYVRIAVADNGTGMDGATQAQIFEPFFTTKAPGRGTGLGLSTVFGIVRQAGGDIGVESAPGTGATFKVYLPQVDPEPVVESQGVPLTHELTWLGDHTRRGGRCCGSGCPRDVPAPLRLSRHRGPDAVGGPDAVPASRGTHRPLAHGRRDAWNEWRGSGEGLPGAASRREGGVHVRLH
jgi:PAS domain S-box-containing protein